MRCRAWLGGGPPSFDQDPDLAQRADALTFKRFANCPMGEGSSAPHEVGHTKLIDKPGQKAARSTVTGWSAGDCTQSPKGASFMMICAIKERLAPGLVWRT